MYNKIDNILSIALQSHGKMTMKIKLKVKIHHDW